MAVLSNADRADVHAQWMREPTGTLTLTKAQIRAAVDAIDSWCEANAAAFNAAIPQPARGQLTAKQKASLLACIVKRRYEVA